MNALNLPPLALIGHESDDGTTAMVVPLAAIELPDGAMLYQLAEVWRVHQSSN